MSGLEEFQHLEVRLSEIVSATDNFKTEIGEGAYGKVYRGVLSISGEPTDVAIKRLNSESNQGMREFLTELQTLCGRTHRNLITLIGYCNQDNEKSIVYEYAECGSLDNYIMGSHKNISLTWVDRIKICIGAATGLDFLHNKLGDNRKIIHRDIKCANILLDANLNAKIADLGLSKLSLPNENKSLFMSRVCGTPGYVEPEYHVTGSVTKESDVFSFGMVLFEIMCCKLCYVVEKNEPAFTASEAKSCYKCKKLEQIIAPDLRKQMCPDSLSVFSEIAYRCLHDNRRKRPSMGEVVDELEEALEFQEKYELAKKLGPKSDKELEQEWTAYRKNQLQRNFKAIVNKLNVPDLMDKTKEELLKLFETGVDYDNGRRRFYMDKDGNHREMIRPAAFLDADSSVFEWTGAGNPSFHRSPVLFANFQDGREVGGYCQITATMLSFATMYEVSLVFLFMGSNNRSPRLVKIKWKSKDRSICSTHITEPTGGGWSKIKLWRFVNYKKKAEFQIVLKKILDRKDLDGSRPIQILGIEFLPVSVMTEDDTYWEKMLPSDYKDIIERSTKHLEYTSKRELYFLLREGILITDDRPLGDVNKSAKLWFSLCELTNGKRHMLSFKDVDFRIGQVNSSGGLSRFSLNSRFGALINITSSQLVVFEFPVRLNMLSPEKAYVCYFVFSHLWGYLGELAIRCFLDGKQHGVKFVKGIDASSQEEIRRLQRDVMNIPTLTPDNDKRSHESIPHGRKALLRQRNDRLEEHCDFALIQKRDPIWFEFGMCKPLHDLHKYTSICFQLIGPFNIAVEGIELRPSLIPDGPSVLCPWS